MHYMKVTSVHDFLAEQLPADYKNLLSSEDAISVRKNDEFARRALTALLVPKKATAGTGKIKDARIEALAREEVDEETLEKLRGITAETTQIDDNCEAYFLLQGNVKQGSKEITRQGLVIVSLMHLQRVRKDELVKEAVVPIHQGFKIADKTVVPS
jgi:hypothetical protein